MLNTRKIDKFIPENRKIKIDRGYVHEEISKLLEIADERMRTVILLYSEYEEAIDNLTIDPANRLQRKIETLTIEKSRLDRIEE
jgi:hypothetical protein